MFVRIKYTFFDRKLILIPSEINQNVQVARATCRLNQSNFAQIENVFILSFFS